MRVECWRVSLLLLSALILAARLEYLERWQGFQEKPMSKENMKPTLSFFIESYNNASNDTYLFQVDKLLRSQIQLTTGVEYLVTVRISRTKCRKDQWKNHTCSIQNKKKLRKSYICDFFIYTVPWMNFYQLWNNTCMDN
ncbi:cystatin-like 1 [Sorex araneus]|uniref:cystatin-like 1 n=1 Tax=Sorex araneus TaxID=42254 RepID=UPI00033150AD|nr:cystatin-like 1 [Sorex araneus]